MWARAFACVRVWMRACVRVKLIRLTLLNLTCFVNVYVYNC